MHGIRIAHHALYSVVTGLRLPCRASNVRLSAFSAFVNPDGCQDCDHNNVCAIHSLCISQIATAESTVRGSAIKGSYMYCCMTVLIKP